MYRLEFVMEARITRSQAWELDLLDRARWAMADRPAAAPAIAGQQLLERAYREAARVTAVHSRSFHLASALLPPRKRRAARALYAFCRKTDDIVDQHDNGAASKLDHWRRRALASSPPEADPIALAWADARREYGIPLQLAEQLIDGIGQDLVKNRYRLFEELAQYAYGVASTVGLMSMHIIGYQNEQAVPYALKMGVALQLTNILRDVGEDWRAGRLYLPLDELAEFGLDEHDIAIQDPSARWRAYARFYIDRNRKLYDEAWPGIAMLDPDGRFAIAAAAELYRAILDEIERNEYDVFTRRAHLGKWAKLRKLPAVWFKLNDLNPSGNL